MSTKGTYALLISGNESRFAEGILKFQEFLLTQSNFNPRKIRVIFCNYLGNDYIIEETQLFFDKVRDEKPKANVVIVYNGHGGKGSFWPNPVSLSYEEWVKLIDHHGKFIFINNSCYSGSAIEAFEKVGILPKKGLVISSSKSDELSYGDYFLDTLLESYLNKQPFVPKEIGRTVYLMLECDPNADNVIIMQNQGEMPKKVLNPKKFY